MSYNREIVLDTLKQISEALDQISIWNENISDAESYLCSPDGMKTLAATCMLLESIGEGINRIEKKTDGTLLAVVRPDIPWESIVGMRNHIAHGYFNIDADFIFETVKNDIPDLKSAIVDLIDFLQ